MASRKKKKQKLNESDLGGYTLGDLLGLDPVAKPPEKSKGGAAKAATAPFKLVGAIVKLPATVVGRLLGGLGKALGEVATLPVRILKALASPWKKK